MKKRINLNKYIKMAIPVNIEDLLHKRKIESTFEKIEINSTKKNKPTEEDQDHYIVLEHIDPWCFNIGRWGSDVATIGDKLFMLRSEVPFRKRRAYQREVGIAPFNGIFSDHGMVLRPNTEIIDAHYFPFS